MSNSFDDLMEIDGLDENAVSDTTRPLFTVSKKPDDVKKWVTNSFISRMKRDASFFEEVKENLKLYKGNIFDKTGDRRTGGMDDPQLEKARNTKLYVNKIHDLVEFRVTTHNAAKPAIDIGPANTDYINEVGAKIAKSVVDSVWYEVDEDAFERKAFRYTFLAGEHYAAPLWDASKGDIHPDYQKWKAEAKAKAESESGEASEEDLLDGNEPIKTGEIIYKHSPAWQTLPESVGDWEKVNELITWEYEYVDVLKKLHPKKKSLIKSIELSESFEGFDPAFLRRLRIEGKTIVIYVWEKRHCYSPNGRWIKTTLNGDVLFDKDLPYEHNEMPWIRLTDLDIPGEFRARSFLRNIKGLQFQHYFLTSMIAANMRLMGYPKWVYEQGSVQIKDFANVRNVMSVRPGTATAPYILQPQPTPPEAYKQIEMLEIAMDTQVKGAFSNPAAIPARTDSAAAFEFLDSKDSQRSHTMFSKVNKFRVDLSRLTVKVAGQFMKPSDKRIVQIIGKNNEYDLKHFSFENLNQPYHYRIAAEPGMPTEKTQRQKFVAGLVKEFPEGTFTKEEIMDWLQLGNVDKMYDMTTKSLKACESIIQDLLQGNSVPPPEGYEDLLVYWKTFGSYIQDRKFKESVPADSKGNVLNYLTAVEVLMWEKAQKNEAFAQILLSLPLYPLVFVLPPAMPPPAPPVEAMSAPAPAGGEPMPPQVDPGEDVNAASDLMRHTAAQSGSDEA